MRPPGKGNPSHKLRDWWYSRCSWCGKWAFPNRKAAKQAHRHLHANDPEIGTYRCRHTPDWAEAPWHYGHSSLTNRAST